MAGGGVRDRLGAGGRIFAPVLAYLILLTAVRLWAPSWLAFSLLPGWAWPVGVVLLVLGLTAYGVALVQLSRAIREGRLATDGLFRCCRHPIYAVLLFLVYIRTEARPLEERFWEAYRSYRGRTGALTPWPWGGGRCDAGKS